MIGGTLDISETVCEDNLAAFPTAQRSGLGTPWGDQPGSGAAHAVDRVSVCVITDW